MGFRHPYDRLMTVEEYFAFEEASATRHESVHGQVHAMSGVTRRHSRITMNIAAQFWIAARGSPCRVHQGEVKVQANAVLFWSSTTGVTLVEHGNTKSSPTPGESRHRSPG